MSMGVGMAGTKWGAERSVSPLSNDRRLVICCVVVAALTRGTFAGGIVGEGVICKKEGTAFGAGAGAVCGRGKGEGNVWKGCVLGA